MSRKQAGYVFHKGSSWFVRFSDSVRQKDGSIKRQQVCEKLPIPYSDGYRSRKSVQPFVDDILNPVNTQTANPHSYMSVGDFTEQVYFKHAETQVRAYTLRNYRQMWDRNLKHRVSSLNLREFRTVHAANILIDLAKQDLSKATLSHHKACLSGIFTAARNLGYLDGPNPVQGAKLPNAPGPAETGFYSLDEIQKMLVVLPEPARIVVQTAAFTGLRRSELQGLRCADYIGQTLNVSRSIVEGETNPTKSKASKAPLPVIRPLATALDNHIRSMGERATADGALFQSSNGEPMRLNHLAQRVVVPALKGTGIVWRGWHSFRRGLATTLHNLGIDDRTVQSICRHSSITVTMQAYMKSTTEAQRQAMATFEKAVEKSLECNELATPQTLLN